MAQYDGSIRIGTNIDTKGIVSGEKEIEKHINLLKIDVEEYSKSLKELESQGKFFGDEDYDKVYLAWKNAADAVKAYQSELDKQTESGQAKIAQQEARALERKEAAQRRMEEQAERNLQKENARIQKQAESEARLQAKAEERRAKEEAKILAQEQEEQRLAQIRNSAVVGNQRIVEVMERRRQLAQEIADMERAGVGAGYQQYDNAKKELSELDEEIKDYSNGVNKVKQSYNRLAQAAKNAFSIAKSAIGKAGAGIQKFGDFVKNAFSRLVSSAKKSDSLLSTMGSRFRGLALSLLIFNQISKAFNAMLSAVREGFGNLYKDVDGFRRSVNGLKASTLTLKNSFAAAFRPLVEVAIPYIQQTVDAMTRLLDVVAQFTAAITGQKTYTKAIRQTTDAIEDENKAQNKQLSGLDKLNNLTSNEGDGKDSSGDKMFEENVPISSGIMDAFQGLKELMGNEDWEGIGGYIAERLNAGLQRVYAVLSSDELRNKVSKFTSSVTGILNGLVNEFDWEFLGKNIGAGVNMVVDTLERMISGVDWVNLGGGLASGLNGIAGEVDFENVGSLIGQKFMILPRILLGFVSNLNWGEIGSQIGNALNGVVSAIDLSQIGEMLGKALTGVFQAVVNFSATFDWEAFGTNIYQGINSFFENTDWETVGQGISDFAIGLLDTLIVAIEGTDWQEMGESIKTLVSNIDWFGLAEKLAEGIGAALGGLAALLWGLIGDAWDSVVLWWNKTAFKDGKFTMKGLLNGIWEGIKNIARWIYDHILKPFVNGFKKAFGLDGTPVMEGLGSDIMSGLLGGIESLIGTVLETIGNVVDGIITVVKGVIDFIVGIFTGDWEKAWDGVTKIFEGIAKTIGGIVSGIIGGIESVLQALGIMDKKVTEYKEPSLLKQGSAIKNISSAALNVTPGYATGQTVPHGVKQQIASSSVTKNALSLEDVDRVVKNAVHSTKGTVSGEITINTPVAIDGREVAKAVQKVNLDQFNRTGRSMFAQ